MDQTILYLEKFFTYRGIHNEIQQQIITYYLDISGYSTPLSSPIKSCTKITQNINVNRIFRPVNNKKILI